MQADCCPGCGLQIPWCCCDQIESSSCQVSVILLLHESEPDRPTTTSKIIQKAIPDTQTFIWQRTSEPEALIKQIEAPDTDAWLLFPADRPELEQRARKLSPPENRKTLLIVPDGTWKEVRKIVRKSPWLEKLPILALNPSETTQYTLRRNSRKDEKQLCSAEALSEALTQVGETESGRALSSAFDLFMERYLQQRKGIKP